MTRSLDGSIPSVSHNFQSGIGSDNANHLFLIIQKYQPVAVLGVQAECTALDLFSFQGNLLAILEIDRDLFRKMLRGYEDSKLLRRCAAL